MNLPRDIETLQGHANGIARTLMQAEWDVLAVLNDFEWLAVLLWNRFIGPLCR